MSLPITIDLFLYIDRNSFLLSLLSIFWLLLLFWLLLGVWQATKNKHSNKLKNKKIINRHILCFFAICLFVFLMTFLKIGCPFLYVFRIPCPTCGVTRALLCLIKFDLAGYFHYHPFAFPLLICSLLMLHIRKIKFRRLVEIISVTVCIGNLILYFTRLFCYI